MRKLYIYDRLSAVEYAKKWALGSNPQYKNYKGMGGDCTNFISQCIHAGGIPFDSSKKNSWLNWFWYNDSERTPSWTAAEAFYNYIINNNNENTQNFGVYAKEISKDELELGDIVQLVNEENAYHTMIITEIVEKNGKIVDYLICQHSYDLLDYPLSLKYGQKRYIKIFGYYKYQ
jgi:hypothetical protein